MFLVVADELHFSRAAQRLHTAQPPVSRTISQLERAIGTPLFERTTRSVRLTPAGRALLPVARDIVRRADQAGAIALSAVAGDVGTVAIAFAGASTHSLVGALTRELRRRHPGIVPTLLSQNFALPAIDLLLRHEADIVLARWEGAVTGVESRVVQTEDLVLAVSVDDPLAASDSVGFDVLAGRAFVTLEPQDGSVLHDRLYRLCRASGFAPHTVQTAPDTWTALALVAAGIGCMLTVSSVRDNVTDPHVRFLPVRDRAEPIHLRMAWLPDSPNPALSRVLDVADAAWPRTIDDQRGISKADN
ncbi:LysR family transcriptional regulator [Pseudonocardia halophobica]